MIRRNTWILLGIFVILAGVTVYLQRSGTLDQDSEPTQTLQPLLFDVNQTDIRRAIVEDLQGDRVVIEKGESTEWTLTQPEVELQDPSLINQAGNQITSIRVINRLESASSLESLGLDQSAYTITLELNDGGEITVNIGNLTPTDSGFYVQKDDGPIQVAAKFNLEILIELLEEATQSPAEVESTPISTE